MLSVQFTPGPYGVPGDRPDTALQMDDSRPVEPYLSVNQTDPGQIAVSTHAAVRVTTNDGRSFSTVGTFPNSAHGDTSTTYDGAGRLFWTNLSTAGIGIAEINPATGFIIPGSVFTVDNNGMDDKEFIAADPNTNNLYVIWTRFVGGTEVLLSRSTDQGANWSRPLRVDSGNDGFVWPATVTVAADGHVFAAYHSQIAFGPAGREGYGNPSGTSGAVFVVRYNNDLTAPLRTLALQPGRADVTYNVQTAPTRKIPQTQFWTQGSDQPWIIADPVRPGNIYVIAADDPTNGAGAPYSRIVFAHSTNNGLTWTSSQPGATIAPLNNNSFQLFPTAAVDPFGDLLVAWYDNRRGLINSFGRFKLDVYATYSTDGGRTFAPAFQINDPNNAFDPDLGTINLLEGPPPTTRIGEYFGSGIFGDTAYLAWNGNSPSSGEQVFFKAFAIPGTLTLTGTGSDDIVTIHTLPTNSAFVEILVNGQRQYTGLWAGLTGITIATTAGNETINLEDAPAGVPVTVNLGSGRDTVNLSPVAQDLSKIAAPVSVNGGSGSGSLFLWDGSSFVGRTFDFTGDTITANGAATVSYNNLANIVLAASNSGNTFALESTSAPLTLKAGRGSNKLIGTSAANTWSITAADTGLLTSANLSGSVTFALIRNLTGGTGPNTFVFNEGATISGNLDGGSGGGSLDYSAYSSSVIVNLQLGTATGVDGTIAHIQNVTGGSGGGLGVYNILVGNGGNLLTGGNGRRNLLIAGSSVSTLQGGDDDDILIGGTTAYDMNPASLRAIMSYWSGTSEDYAMRVSKLLTGNGVPRLDARTVTSNAGGNTLNGLLGLNLYYGNRADTTDLDPKSGELFVPI